MEVFARKTSEVRLCSLRKSKFALCLSARFGTRLCIRFLSVSEPKETGYDAQNFSKPSNERRQPHKQSLTQAALVDHRHGGFSHLTGDKMTKESGKTGSPSAFQQARTVATIAGTIATSVATAHSGDVGRIATSAGEGYSQVRTIEAQRNTSGKSD